MASSSSFPSQLPTATDTFVSLSTNTRLRKKSRRSLSKAIYAQHQHNLQFGFAHLLQNVRRKTLDSSHPRLTIVDRGEMYRQQRLRALSKGLKSLWGNTEQQKKEMATKYYCKRMASVVFGAWASATHTWKESDREATEAASEFSITHAKRIHLQRLCAVSSMQIDCRQNQKLSKLFSYLISLKYGVAALKKFKDRAQSARAGERTEHVYSAAQIALQRYMSSWYQYWRTRRVHSDLLLYHFSPAARLALIKWRQFTKACYERRQQEDVAFMKAAKLYRRVCLKHGLRKLRRAVTLRAFSETVAEIDYSPLDEVLVRRVFSALRKTVSAGNQDFTMTRNGIKRIIMLQARQALRRLQVGAQRAGDSRQYRSDWVVPFSVREAKKRMLLQWLRLLTRNIVYREAYSSVVDYLQWGGPFRKRSVGFKTWRRRVSALVLGRRRLSFAALSYHNRCSKHALASLVDNVRFRQGTEKRTRRTAVFHWEHKQLTMAMSAFRARTGPALTAKKRSVVRSVMFLKLWHCGKAINNWRVCLHRRRRRRLQWAQAQSDHTTDQARLATRYWISAAFGPGAGRVSAAHGGTFPSERSRRLALWTARKWRLFTWRRRLGRTGELPAEEESVRAAFLSYLYKASHAHALCSSGASRAAAVQLKYSQYPPFPASSSSVAPAVAAASKSKQPQEEDVDTGDTPLYKARPRTCVFEAIPVLSAYASPMVKPRAQPRAGSFVESPDSVTRFPVMASPGKVGDKNEGDGGIDKPRELLVHSSAGATPESLTGRSVLSPLSVEPGISGDIADSPAAADAPPPSSSSPGTEAQAQARLRRRKKLALAREIISFVSELQGLGPLSSSPDSSVA
jgi:hypothetical protein